ncbi:unnamed protein product [Rhizoctonia solani]|uniref:Transmembrane protein n=1 Tax=Rhizoctonia solani TaxID=456999 RepID=A0A8H3H7R4_9AGAM|nr:unnamed protein product [Rhizoctonia solani]
MYPRIADITETDRFPNNISQALTRPSSRGGIKPCGSSKIWLLHIHHPLPEMLRNITLDDSSPLIQYDALWADGFNSTADTEMYRYQGRSFHCTNVDGATANITFRGTAIYVYGAKRHNHGYYRFDLNNQTGIPMSGQPAGTAEEFQTLLFSKEGLPNGENTLKLTNVRQEQGKDYVDIDYIVITREVDASSEVQSAIASGDDFTYSSLWERQANKEYYRNSTAHVTNTPGETATLKFQGSEISVYGGVGPAFGTFRVRVDKQDPVVLNATTGFTHPPLTLFTTSGLGDGQHTLTITNLEGGKSMTIDYAEYTPQSGASTPGGSNAGIIGGVVGGVLGGLAVLAVLGWYLIRRRKRARHGGLDGPLPPMSMNPQWESQIQVTPYVNEPGQPPLGYVDHRPASPSTHTLTSTTRKTEMSGTPLPTLRSDESSYGPSLQPGFSALGSASDAASIHEVDAGTLPPMYHQVFSTPPPLRDVGASTHV